MLIATKGIVLKVVKYGDTSIICSIFTELLGLQTYLVKGIRSEKKQSLKGNIFRPGNILEMQVHHQEGKTMHYIKEYHLAIFFNTIGERVIKNTLLLFAVEVLSNLVSEDAQEDLFDFSIDFFKYIDAAPEHSVGNMPIYFLKETAKMMGYAISDNYSETNCYLNTYEGNFQSSPAALLPSFDAYISAKIYEIATIDDIENIDSVKLNSAERAQILEAYLHFLQWHDKSFKPLKCLPILQAILH